MSKDGQNVRNEENQQGLAALEEASIEHQKREGHSFPSRTSIRKLDGLRILE